MMTAACDGLMNAIALFYQSAVQTTLFFKPIFMLIAYRPTRPLNVANLCQQEDFQ